MHSSTSGSSYTAITPHTRVAGHLIARFELLANLSIENALTVSTATARGYRLSQPGSSQYDHGFLCLRRALFRLRKLWL